MAFKIKLTKDHQEILVSALLASSIEKKQFVDAIKHEQTMNQYIDAATKLLDTVTCGRSGHNIFTWLIDQIKHSPRLAKTELGKHAIIIADAASHSEKRYEDFCYVPPIDEDDYLTENLFEFSK